MRRFLRFKLRTALIWMGVLCVLLAISVNYAASRRAQRRNVQKLEELGAFWETPDGNWCNIQVWYDDDLAWNKEENRFELDFFFYRDNLNGYTISGKSYVKDWFYRNLGRDFLHSPVVLEISCDDFPNSPQSLEIINQIRKLPTVRQVWIIESFDAHGELVNKTANDDLRRIFPDLIVASPQ